MIQALDINKFGFRDCYRARNYNPSVGRFLTEDPIGFGGGDVNLYRFVRNNSVRHTDPTGLRPIDYDKMREFGDVFSSLMEAYLDRRNKRNYRPIPSCDSRYQSCPPIVNPVPQSPPPKKVTCP